MNKTVLQIIGIIILVMISVVLMIRIKEVQQKAKESQAIIRTELLDSVQYYVNKLDQIVAQKQVLEITTEGLRDNLEALGLDNKALKDQVGKLSNLKERLQAQIESHTSIQVIDTTDRIKVTESSFDFEGDFKWNNEFLSIVSIYSFKGEYAVDSTLIFKNLIFAQDLDYKYNVGLTSTTYRRRDPKWKIWEEKQLVTDIVLSDPNAKVTDIQSIQIVEPPKKIYQKTWFWMAVTAVGTTLVVK